MYGRKLLLHFAFIWGNIVSTTFAKPELSEALLDYAGTLLARQGGICTTACSDSSTVLNDCVNSGGNASCLCTVPNAHLLQQCIDCTTMLSDPTALPTAQKLATSFNSLCVSSASSITPLTVSGGIPSGSGTTGGVSVTAPNSPTPTPSPAPIPSPDPSTPAGQPGQVTIGPSTPGGGSPSPVPSNTTPPPQGAAMSMMAPTFELASLLIISVTFFSL